VGYWVLNALFLIMIVEETHEKSPRLAMRAEQLSLLRFSLDEDTVDFSDIDEPLRSTRKLVEKRKIESRRILLLPHFGR
jgi:hypothetical protein